MSVKPVTLVNFYCILNLAFKQTIIVERWQSRTYLYERRASAGRQRRRRLPNEVSGTRSITLDLFSPSPYLRQTFTLFTTLLRARSGQLSFVDRCRNNVWRASPLAAPAAAADALAAALRTLLTHIRLSMPIVVCFFC